MTRATFPERRRARTSRSIRQCFGMCRITSTKPSTARSRMCWSTCTPASCIRSPPTPVSRKDAPSPPPCAFPRTRALSSRATLDACRSPDGSPAMKRISRTVVGDRRPRPSEGGQCLLDLAHDAQRDRERISAILSGDNDLRFALNGGDKTLVLEAQWLALRRLQLVTIHELLDGLRVFRELGEVETFLQLVELSRPCREV